MEYSLRIARHTVKVAMAEDIVELLPSMSSFLVAPSADECLYCLRVDNDMEPSADRQRLRTVDTGNGTVTVYTLPNGAYEFVVNDVKGANCCLLHADDCFRHCRCALNGDWQMRNFGLNAAMMLVFAYAGSQKKTLLLHASCVRNNDKAYVFVAKSGTGKSTHTSLWMTNVEGCDLVNDDNPVVRIEGGVPFVYGSPWSGKTPCYRNIRATLGAVTAIVRAGQDSMEKLPAAKAFATLLAACSTMRWDSGVYGSTCDTIADIVALTPLYALHCLPDREAAILCHNTLTACNGQ